MPIHVREQVHEEVLELYLKGYRVAAWVLGLYYLALVPVHFVAQSVAVGKVMVWVNLPTAAIFLGCYVGMRTGRIRARHGFMVPASCLLAALLNHLALVALTGRLQLTSDLMMILVATSVVSPRTRSFLVFLASFVGVWLVGQVLLRHPTGDRLHWGMGVTTAAMVSIALHAVSSRLAWMQARLRVKDQVLAERQRRISRELQEALERVRILRGLIPMCGHCKKIRDDQGYWQQVERYIEERSEAAFTHGLCPDCEAALRAEFEALVPVDVPPQA